MKKYFISSNQI